MADETLLEFRVAALNGDMVFSTRVDLCLVNETKRVALRIEQASQDGSEPDVVLLDAEDVVRLHAMLKGH